MAQNQYLSDNSFADTPLINDQWYEPDYDLWNSDPLAELIGLQAVGSRRVRPLLLLIMVMNFGWLIFIATTAVRVMNIPSWVSWLPYVATCFLLLLPAVVNGRLVLRPSISRLCLLWFLGGILISLYRHPFMTDGLLRFAGFMLLALITYVLLPAAYSWDKIIRVLRGTIVWAAAISLGISVLFFPIATISFGSKVGGIFLNRNSLGYVAFLGLVALGGTLPRKRWRAVFHIGLLFFFGAILLLSRARTSVASAIICGLLVFWHYRKRFSMWFIALVMVTSLLLFGLIVSPEGESLLKLIIYKTRFGGAGGLTSGRLEIWHATRELSRGHEFLGMGIGSLVSYYDISPHSAYMALLFELGYIGFLGFVLWVLTSILQARSLRKYCDPQAAALVQNMFVLLVGLAVYNLFENALGGIVGFHVFVFWVGAGAISNAAAQAHRYGYLQLE